MKKKMVSLILLLVIVGTVCLMHLVLKREGFYNIQSIDLQQTEVESGTEKYFQRVSVGVYAQLKQFEGVSLFDIRLKDVRAVLAQQAWIEEFQVTRRWPNTLGILIKTKQILVNVSEANSKISPVSVNGEKLPAVSLGDAPDRIFLDQSKMYSDLDLRQKSLAVLKEIPQDGKFSQHSIAVLGFEKDSGFWAKLVDHDVKVQLGFEDVAIKSKRVSQVIDHLQNAGIDPRVIEADMNKKVLVKTRKSLSN